MADETNESLGSEAVEATEATEVGVGVSEGGRRIPLRRLVMGLSTMAVGAAVVFTYTVAGGLYAAIWTDFVQIYVAIGGFLRAGAALGLDGTVIVPTYGPRTRVVALDLIFANEGPGDDRLRAVIQKHADKVVLAADIAAAILAATEALAAALHHIQQTAFLAVAQPKETQEGPLDMVLTEEIVLSVADTTQAQAVAVPEPWVQMDQAPAAATVASVGNGL